MLVNSLEWKRRMEWIAFLCDRYVSKAGPSGIEAIRDEIRRIDRDLKQRRKRGR